MRIRLLEKVRGSGISRFARLKILPPKNEKKRGKNTLFNLYG
jgi:hypothetical protein